MEREVEISLPEAAKELGISWAATWRLVLTGTLAGRRDKVSGRWRVERSSVDQVKKSAQSATPGKNVDQ